MQGSTSVTQLRSLLSPRPTQSYDDCATSFYLAMPEKHFFKEAVTQSVCRIFCKKHSAHSRVPAAHCDLEQVSHRRHGGRGVHEQKRLTSELQGKVRLGGRKKISFALLRWRTIFVTCLAISNQRTLQKGFYSCRCSTTLNGTRQKCKDRAFGNALCTRHHLSHAHFFSLQVVCPLVHSCLSACAHICLFLVQIPQRTCVGSSLTAQVCECRVTGVFGKKTHLHPCSIHFPCCTRSATLTCTSPRHLPAHLPLRHFRDQLRRHFSRKAQLRWEVCGLALWPTRTSSQVVSPRMTWTMTRKSHLSPSLTSTTTNPISSLIWSPRAIRQSENPASGKQQQALFFNPLNFFANPSPGKLVRGERERE